MSWIKSISILAATGLIIIGIVGGWELYMQRVESPAYTVIKKEQGIEIREYQQLVVAQVRVTGERKPAIQKGFRILAEYIFGFSKTGEEIAMTKPVLQQHITSEKEKEFSKEDKEWLVQFTMPSQYAYTQLPAPSNPLVQLVKLGQRKLAVLVFSGEPTDERIEAQIKLLKEKVKILDLHVINEPLMAFYNPPWTLSFLRRNEVMLELK